jgi:acetyl/propionyl-CoA carboxylase alpha subunit
MAEITKLLIANRGEIARRIIRAARAEGLATVVVFSDADAAAPFVAEADEAVRLPGVSAAETYLRRDRIVAAAQRTGADAVHPGYGFLAEDAGFVRSCEDAGLVFVGPSSAVVAQMGDKLEAKRIMSRAGVPTLPGMVVEAEPSVAEAREWSARVGLPLLVKAAYGGGGRGMRVVPSVEDLGPSIVAAQREAAASFGNPLVFLERYVQRPRHVEVQIFGDAHGTVVHLFERECSIQRRHQKVIEESPSPALDGATRDEICAAAVTAAKAIGYVGAGTVEFVLEGDGSFWFLEVNTRLQVEHPVTELVTGLDLVALQLRVAQGHPLPPDVVEAEVRGHAVEARLYAEDVPGGFLPVSGALHRIRFPAGVRVDSGYEDGAFITPYYDALIAKVIAWAPSRGQAAARLADSLARTELHGVDTNRDLLVGTLRHPEFLAGDIDTGFYERHDPAALSRPSDAEETETVHAAATLVWAELGAAAVLPVPAGIPPSWRNVGLGPSRTTYRVGDRELLVASEHRRDGDVITVGERRFDITRAAAVPDELTLELDGVRRRYRMHRVGSSYFVDSELGSTHLIELDRFPPPVRHEAAGSLHSPLPGSVVGLHVGAGDRVRKGDKLVSLEAMKMEHTIAAPHDGTVTEVLVAVGDQVEAAQVLVVVAAEEA